MQENDFSEHCDIFTTQESVLPDSGRALIPSWHVRCGSDDAALLRASLLTVRVPNAEAFGRLANGLGRWEAGPLY
jgi:hypothetical protein